MTTEVSSRARSRTPALLAVLAGLVFLAGIAVGTAVDGSRDEQWKSGTAHLGDHQFSVESDGWTYGAEGSIPWWIDARGTEHEGGWPDCLSGPVGSERTVRFLAPTVRFDGGSFQPVVVVDCRG